MVNQLKEKKSNLVKKTPIKDFIKNTLEGKYADKKKGTAESSEMILNKFKSIKRKKGGEIIKANTGKSIKRIGKEEEELTEFEKRRLKLKAGD